MKKSGTNNKNPMKKVTITAHLLSATTTIKFPCYFTLLWRTQDNSHELQTQKIQTQAGTAQFNQSLNLTVHIHYDSNTKRYGSANTQLLLRLLSKNKQTEPKLVGRTIFDVAGVLNGDVPSFEAMEFKLDFCTVNAVVKAMFEVHEVVEEEGEVEVKAEKIKGPWPKSPPSRSVKKDNEFVNQPVQNRQDQPLSSQSASIQPVSQVMNFPAPQTPSGQFSRPLASERSYDFNSSIDQIKLKSLQNDHKFSTSKLVQQNQLISLTLTQKQQTLKTMQDELGQIKIEAQRLRDEIRKKTEENISFQLVIADNREFALKQNDQWAAVMRQNSKMSQLVNHIQQEAMSMQTELQEKISSVEQQNKTLKICGTHLQRQLLRIQNQCQGIQNELIENLNIRQAQPNYREAQTKTWEKQKQNLNASLNQQKQIIIKIQSELKLSQQDNNKNSQTISAQKTQISSYHEQIQQLQSVNNDQQKRIEQLEAILLKKEQKIEEQVNSKTILMGEMQNKQQTHEEDIRKLKDELDNVNNQAKKVQEVLNLKLTQVEQQLLLNRNQAAQRSQQLSNTSAQFNQVQQTNYHLTSQLTQFQNLLLSTSEIKSQELSQAQQQQHSSHLKLIQLQQQNHQAVQLAKRHEQKVGILQEEMKQNQRFVQKLQDGLNKHIQTNEQLNEKIIKIAEKGQSYLGEIRKLENQVIHVGELLQKAENKEEAFNQRIVELEGEIERYSQVIGSEQLRSKELEQQMRSFQENQTKISKYTEELQDRLAQVEAQLISAKQKITEKDISISDLNSKLGQLQQNMDISEQNYQQLSQKINLTEKQTSSELIELTKTKVQLSQELQQLKKDLTATAQKEIKLNQEIMHLSLNNQELNATLTQTQEESKRLEEQITALNIQIEEQLQAHELKIAELMENLETVTMEQQEQRNQDADKMGELMANVEILKKKLEELGNQHEKNEGYQGQNVVEREEVNGEVDQKVKEEVIKLEGQIQMLRIQNELLKVTKTKQNQPQVPLVETPPTATTQNIQPSTSQAIKTPDQLNQLKQLLQIKQDQIRFLQQDLDRLASQTQEVYSLRQQVQAYRQQLQINEEQRFNLEAAHNQNNIMVIQLQEENIKLNDEIAIMTQRNNDMEDTLQHFQNLDHDVVEQKGTQKDELAELREVVKELKSTNAILKQELDQKDQEHVVDLIDQHIRLSKSDLHNSNLAKSASKLSKDHQSDFVDTCGILKELLQERKSLDIHHKQSRIEVENIDWNQIPSLVRMVSLELQRGKSQLFKNDKKGQISNILRPCEQKVKTLCDLIENISLI